MSDARKEFLLEYIKNKDVLELGIGDGEIDLLHKFIRDNSKSVTSIDIDVEKVKKFSALGYNVSFGDAQDFNLNKKFDVVFAGEIIEHLSNAGLMLDCVRRHLRSDGVLIVTTPNLYSINHLLRGFFLGGNVVFFHEHSLGFTEGLLRELVGRHRFFVLDFFYFNSRVNTLGNKVIVFLSFFVPRWREYMFVVLKK